MQARIEALEAELRTCQVQLELAANWRERAAVAEAALEPFAEAASMLDKHHESWRNRDTIIAVGNNEVQLRFTVGELRAARAALREQGAGEEEE
jgi:hypothetical protein